MFLFNSQTSQVKKKEWCREQIQMFGTLRHKKRVQFTKMTRTYFLTYLDWYLATHIDLALFGKVLRLSEISATTSTEQR